MGPWRHSQVNYDAFNLGPLKWQGDTALEFRRDVLRPFFDQYLKTDAPEADTPPVFIYNTGENHWDRLQSWPLACEADRAAGLKPLYLEADFGLGFEKPTDSGTAADSYVSIPRSRFRTSRARFIPRILIAGSSGWSPISGRWLTGLTF